MKQTYYDYYKRLKQIFAIQSKTYYYRTARVVYIERLEGFYTDEL